MESGPENLRSVTHDMRNLLTAVRGHAELALRGIPPEDPTREDIAHVVVVTATIFDLIDQLDGNDTSDTLIAVNLDTSVSAMRRVLDALLPGEQIVAAVHQQRWWWQTLGWFRQAHHVFDRRHSLLPRPCVRESPYREASHESSDRQTR